MTTEASPRPKGGPSRFLLRLAIALLILLNLGFVVIYVLGSQLPVGHEVTLERRYETPRGEVWKKVRNFAESPDWRSDTSAIKLVNESDYEVWEAKTSFGPLRIAVEVDEEPARLITRILDHDDFGGTWTYEFEELADGGTRLSLTENGMVHGVMFRFFGHYVFGYEATAELFLDDLERALKQE